MAKAKKVLIIEDDCSLIGALREHLSRVAKHELYVALTGEEGLKIIETEKPDVVLLDMQLPGIKGTQVLEIIRKKYPATKVLVITSYDAQVKNIAAKLAVDGFFPKPLVFNEVAKRVEEVLKVKEGEDTTVIPVTLVDVKRRDDVVPKAKILFIEKEFWMPYLLPISDSDEYPPPLVEPYGEYEYEVVYCQKEAMRALVGLKPDIVICATDVPLEDRCGTQSISTADLIVKIMGSRYAPKGIIVHGTQQDINSHGLKSTVDDSSTWVGDVDPYGHEAISEKDKENAERLNKMIWRICFDNDLVKKVN